MHNTPKWLFDHEIMKICDNIADMFSSLDNFLFSQQVRKVRIGFQRGEN